MKIFSKYALMILTIIGIISFQGCEDDGELPKVIAGFTFTANEDTGTVTFINISENASTYLWDFGDGETSKEIDPIKTYAAGTFIVTLTANNVSGVSDVFKDTITVNIKGIISLPATFDDPNINYKATAFDGASFDIVDNPDLAGTNNKTTKVGAITNSGAVFEGVFFELGTAVDFATNKRITMNFWSEDIIDVLLKFEGTSPSIEKSTIHGGTGWESISFDFTSSNKFGKLVLFVDGPGTKAGTFFVDDIKQEATPVVPVTCTAETVQSISAADFNLTHQADPSASIISDNAGFAWVDNPDFDDSVNPSCKVGQITRTTANAFVNNQIDLNAKLDFNANAGFKAKVRSAVAGFTLTIKLEDKTNSSINTELTVAATKTNEWEELTFPFASNQSNKYDKIIIFFDLGKTNSSIYFIDDLRLFAGSGVDTEAPVIALNGNATINLIEGAPFVDPGATAADNVDGDITGDIVVSGDVVDNGTVGTYIIRYNVSDAAANAATEVTRTVNVNPFDDGLLVNGSFQAGANPWIIGVGTTPVTVVTDNGNVFYSVDVLAAGNPFDVNMSQKLAIIQDETYILTFDAWSDRSRTIIAGIGLSGGSFANTAQPVSLTTDRQTFTLTLTATGFGASDARVLFDSGAEIGLVNIDNVSLVVDNGGGPGSGGNLAANGDFETGDATGWFLFQNGGTAALDNTQQNGGAWSGRLATGGQSNPAFKQERIGAGTVAAGDVVRVQFDHIGAVVQPGAVFNVLLFGEGAAGASFTHVFNPAPMLSAGWTTFSGQFTIAPGTDVSEGISFLIEAVCGGDVGCSVTANIDNVTVTLNP